LLKQKAAEGAVTLVYAARDEEHNGALVLKRFLQGHEHPTGADTTGRRTT
jgi:uncharacterized protein YeaO (DUF488 family)